MTKKPSLVLTVTLMGMTDATTSCDTATSTGNVLPNHQFNLSSISILLPSLAISLDLLIQNGTQNIAGLSTPVLTMLFFAMHAECFHCQVQEELEKLLRLDIMIGSMQLEKVAF